MNSLQQRTLCKDCKFHRHIIRNVAAPEVWYNHFCGASELPESVDPTTGEVGFVGVNDFGQTYITNIQFKFCRDVNNGNCHLFESAE